MFWKAWFKKTIPEKIRPTSRRVVSYDVVHRLLRNRFPQGEIYLSDHYYLLCSTADISKFLQQDATNKYKYDSDRFDCDDFAYRLMGQFSIPDWSYLAFGLIWTDKHAMNILITEDERILFVEPQSDIIQENLQDWQGSKIRFVTM